MTAIKDIRKRMNITQKQLADLAGINQTDVSRYENGERIPTLSVAIKIAKALNCTVDELVKEQ